MKPTLYLDTTISSLLTARPSRDPLTSGQITATKQRWRLRRPLELLRWFATHADDFWVFENSDSERHAPTFLACGGRLGAGEMQMEPPHPAFDSPVMEVLRRCPFAFLPTSDAEPPN